MRQMSYSMSIITLGTIGDAHIGVMRMLAARIARPPVLAADKEVDVFLGNPTKPVFAAILVACFSGAAWETSWAGDKPMPAVVGNMDFYDGNKDGVIDRGEFDAAKRMKPAGYGYSPRDLNKNGRTDAEEFRLAFEQAFDSLDLDRNGRVSIEEFPPAIEEGEPEFNTQGRKAFFKIHDIDSDGAITRHEFLTFGDAEFARLDENRDGALSRDDVELRRQKRLADRMARQP